MTLLKQIMDIIGYIGTVWLLVSGALILFAWSKGILVPLLRLGDGLSKRKITIFSKGDNKESFESLLLDSSLFTTKNVQTITKREDFGRCEGSTLYLVIWNDFGDNLEDILSKKDDKTALIIYAQPKQLVSKDWVLLQEHRNVTVTNLKGRLLNDTLVSLMVTGYDKK